MDEVEHLDPPVDMSMRLDSGVELLGKYRSSGLRRAPYLLRRPDGQVVQVSLLLYLIATQLDAERHPDPAERSLDEIAARVSTAFGQEVTKDNVVYLIEHKLRPAGLLAIPDGGRGTAATPTRANPLLALRLRLPMVPARLHGRLTRLFEPLFRPPVVAAGLVGLVAMDGWLLLGQVSGIVAGTRQLIYQPQLLLGLTLLVVVSGAFHEFGHAAAARYGGATPGAMGAGIYLVWPVFYTDVTDAYRLDRRGRLRTDLGGVYFNVLFALAVALVYLATGYQPLLVFLVVAQMETARQFLPFVRLDGYYVVSDLAGVPNLFPYVKPVLVNLFRYGDQATRTASRAQLHELTPRARRLIVAWVCVTVPVLLVNVVVFLLLAPRLAGAAWGSAGGQFQEMTTHGRLDILGVVNGLLGLTLLVLPLVGMSYIFVLLAGRLSRNVRTWWQHRPLATATATVVVVTVVVLQVAMEWPNTFAAALRHAQVAQDVEEARDEGGWREPPELASGLPVSENADADPPDATTSTVPDDTVPPADSSTTERPGSSTTEATEPTRSAVEEEPPGTTSPAPPSTRSSTTAPASGGGPSPESPSPPTTTAAPRPAPPRGGRPTTSTTTSTTPAPPNLLEDILDLLF